MPIVRPIREQTEPAFTLNVDPDDHLYRTAGGRSTRDLPQFIHDRMLSVALNLYRINPLAFRFLELIRDFTVGGGVTFHAEDKTVHERLERHWSSPLNRWDERLPQRSVELNLFGELCLYARKNDVNGDVFWQYISPFDIEDVEIDPFSYEIYRSVIVKPSVVTEGLVTMSQRSSANILKPVRLQAIEYDANSESETHGYYVGEALFYAVNKTTDAKRGISRLFNLAEWLDGMDQFFFNRLERSTHMNMWMWDVKLEGMNDTQIEDWLKKQQASPPRPGSIRAHNERVEWKPVTPDIKGQDNADEAEFFLRYITGAAGFGSHFVGMPGGSVGQMASAELTVPILKTLEYHQDEIRFLLKRVFEYVIDQHILAGQLDKNVSRRVEIIMPRLSMRDLQRSSGAIFRTMQAIQLAMEKELVSQEEGRIIMMNLLDQLGLAPRKPVLPDRMETEN